jgi:hypothetical protein
MSEGKGRPGPAELLTHFDLSRSETRSNWRPGEGPAGISDAQTRRVRAWMCRNQSEATAVRRQQLARDPHTEGSESLSSSMLLPEPARRPHWR